MPRPTAKCAQAWRADLSSEAATRWNPATSCILNAELPKMPFKNFFTLPARQKKAGKGLVSRKEKPQRSPHCRLRPIGFPARCVAAVSSHTMSAVVCTRVGGGSSARLSGKRRVRNAACAPQPVCLPGKEVSDIPTSS